MCPLASLVAHQIKCNLSLDGPPGPRPRLCSATRTTRFYDSLEGICNMGLNLKSLISKLNDTARAALEGAAGLCLSRTHYDIEIEHYLMKVLDVADSDATRIFRQYELNTSKLAHELTRSLDGLKSGNARTPVISPTVLKM